MIAAWAGKRIHQLEQISVQSFDPGVMDAAVAVLERRNTLSVSIVEGQLYLELDCSQLPQQPPVASAARPNLEAKLANASTTHR